MGLTIHFTLAAPPDTDAARAGELVRQLRRRALDFKQRDRVDTVHPLGDDAEALRWAEEWLFFPVPHHPERRHQLCVRPLEGFLFPVGVGEDCEPLWLATIIQAIRDDLGFVPHVSVTTPYFQAVGDPLITK